MAESSRLSSSQRVRKIGATTGSGGQQSTLTGRRPEKRKWKPIYIGFLPDIYQKDLAIFGVPVVDFTDYDYKNAENIYLELVDPITGIWESLDESDLDEFIGYIQEQIGELKWVRESSPGIYIFSPKENLPGIGTAHAEKLNGKTWKGKKLVVGVMINPQ